MTASGSLRTKLADARQALFAGRDAELRRFRDCLHSDRIAVLHVYGPGGVGKTWLLEQMARVAVQDGVEVCRIDARDIEPSPAGVRRALDQLGFLDSEQPSTRRSLFIIDTYERLAAIDDWIREGVIADLAASTFVVLAGRNRPAPAWSSDAGWSALSEIMPLRNFRPDEALRYLELREVEESRRAVLISTSHGHPLALSLLTDLESRGELGSTNALREQPDLVRILLDRFVSSVEPGHRKWALEISAHARVTSEELLREALELEDASDLFTWLRGLSFMQEGTYGLFPHDLARDVLDADLRWRDPRRYTEMHGQVRRPSLRRIRQLSGVDQQQAANDLLYLHRNGPIMGEVFQWASLGVAREEPATDDDLPGILSIAERFEGPETAEIVRYWYERNPAFLYAHRTLEANLTGFALAIQLNERDERDIAADPAIKAMWAFIDASRLLRPGDLVVYHRLFMDATVGSAPSASLNLMAMRSTVDWIVNSNLSWSFLAVRSLEFWMPIFTYLDVAYLPDAGFSIGERAYHVFGHDWRARPVDAWLELMGEREIAKSLPPPVPPEAAITVLSRPDFEQAVRQALKDLDQPVNLRKNPLLRSRCVVGESADRDRIAALRELLLQAIESLRASPRDEKLYRAVYHTYVQPAGSQERAAELLDLPFNTYRYHLSGALRRITDSLWALELDQ